MGATGKPIAGMSVRPRASDDLLKLPRSVIRLKSPDLPEEEDFEIGFLEGVLRGDPCDESSLVLLAHLYTQRGEYAKGLAMDERLSKLRPEDRIVYYNLACSLSLLGRVDEAFEALERSVKLGYRELSHMLKDPDLEEVRQDARFGPLCRRLGLLGPVEGEGDATPL